MVKKFMNTAVVCLLLANLTLSIRNGFNWLSIIAVTLSALALVLDFAEVMFYARE